MKSAEFAQYKQRYRTAIRRVLAEAEPGRLDESGFPAYSHRNPLINWLFWQRLRIVMEYAARRAPYGLALDYGCGSGVMLPFLSGISRQVIASDIDLLPLQRVSAHIPLAANVRIHDGSGGAAPDLEPGCVDVILALDVLEHVDDLPGTLHMLLRVLRPGGQLIVSGPTENVLYQLGRRLAGREYSGAYHERGIASVRLALGKMARVEHIATLYWPVPLFDIFAATA